MKRTNRKSPGIHLARILLASLWVICCTPTLYAQTSVFKVDTAGTVLLNMNTDAGFVIKGLFGSGNIPATGAGTRLMWHPRKAAFRAGLVTSSQWDEDSVGEYSFASGLNSTAKAMAANALGYGSTASGGFSLAGGWTTTASGNASMAFGYSTVAASYASCAIGRYNIGGGTSANWVPTDPLFEIGNGANGTARNNAVTVLKNGNVGIGTSTPAAPLHIAASGPADGNVLCTGEYGNGVGIPASGAGTRLMWYPRKASFRAGQITSTQWDEDSVGAYSFAAGYNTKAKGEKSTALGTGTTASGDYSIAMGSGTTASGQNSTAMGISSRAINEYSTALGYVTIASGYSSTAMGYRDTASGDYSIAIGANNTASGQHSTAMGWYTTASGDHSTAMGSRVNTNGKDGSFIIGDQSTTTIHYNTLNNQMKMRFNGGYVLYSKSDTTTGVYMNGGTSGWTNISDRNRKENVRALDGEALLSKIRHLPVTEWNYRNTDPAVRYIGPTAQDFWQAFHLGGTDSLGINTICIDGVNMAAVQALEQRTSNMETTRTTVQTTVNELADARRRIASMQTQIHELIRAQLELTNRLTQIESARDGQHDRNDANKDTSE